MALGRCRSQAGVVLVDLTGEDAGPEGGLAHAEAGDLAVGFNERRELGVTGVAVTEGARDHAGGAVFGTAKTGLVGHKAPEHTAAAPAALNNKREANGKWLAHGSSGEVGFEGFSEDFDGVLAGEAAVGFEGLGFLGGDAGGVGLEAGDLNKEAGAAELGGLDALALANGRGAGGDLGRQGDIQLDGFLAHGGRLG